MKNWIVVLGAALVLMLAGCGGGGNGGGSVTPPPPPPPPPTPTALTVTLTPVSVDLDQAAKPASGSIFIGQQATIKVTQGTATITNATLTASAGTINQSTFTAPGSAATVTISAKGTDGATGSATISVVKPDVPAVVAAVNTGAFTTLWHNLVFTDNNGFIASGTKTSSTGSSAILGSFDVGTMQLKTKDASGSIVNGTLMEKTAIFGGSNDSNQPFMVSYDAALSTQKTSFCGFEGLIQSLAYDPSNNGIWLGIRTPNQAVIALADAPNFQINCSSVYLVKNAGQANVSAVMPFSGGLMVIGFTGGFVAPLGQTIPGSAEAFVILMDRNGNILKENHYNNSSADRPFIGSTVAVGPISENGETFFYMAGSKLLNNGANLWVQKFNVNAEPVWSTPYEWSGDISPSVASAYAMIANPKGGVIIAGDSTRPDQAVVNLDFNITDGVIMGIKPDGTKNWNPARFNYHISDSVFNKASFLGMGIQPDGGYVWVSGMFKPWQKDMFGQVLKVALP